MERIILVGHGSPKEDANSVEATAAMLHRMLHPGCSGSCVRVAYLQFVPPDIATVLDACAAEGARRVIVIPFFLYAGMHVTKDIPVLINEGRIRHPAVEFIYTEPLGVHEGLARIVVERIDAATRRAPADIERRSFEIISDEADFSGVLPDRLPIVKRVVHATADFEFIRTLTFHADAVKSGIGAIRDGKDVLTDVEMVRAGIAKTGLASFGGKVFCRIPADGLSHGGRTRAETGMEQALRGEHNFGIVAIGNAPTALLKAVEILREEPPGRRPLVVGVPVGFVKAVESKALLSAQTFPFITNLSRKGGTPVAVAIVNALIKMAGEDA